MPVRPGLLSGFRLPSPTKASLEAHGVGFSGFSVLSPACARWPDRRPLFEAYNIPQAKESTLGYESLGLMGF